MAWENNYRLSTTLIYLILVTLIVLSVTLGPDWWGFATFTFFLLIHVVRDATYGYFPFGTNDQVFQWHTAFSGLAIVGALIVIWRSVTLFQNDKLFLGILFVITGAVIFAGHTFALATKQKTIYAV